MLEFLVKQFFNSAMSIPQSILGILAEGKFEILQYDVFTCCAVS